MELRQIDVDVGNYVDSMAETSKTDSQELNNFLNAITCTNVLEVSWNGGYPYENPDLEALPPSTTTRWATTKDLSTELNREINHYFVALKNTTKLIALADQTDNAGSVLLGTMVNMLNRFHLVSQTLSKVQSASSLNSVIEQMNIRVAAKQWKDFAAWAEKQVS